MTTYNGWTNYATWRVNLEIFDGTTASDHIGPGRFTGGRMLALMDVLRDKVEEMLSDTNNNIARDYALAFIEDVNWGEIADHMLEDEDEDEDERAPA